jgi:hypothetical protein
MIVLDVDFMWYAKKSKRRWVEYTVKRIVPQVFKRGFIDDL